MTANGRINIYTATNVSSLATIFSAIPEQLAIGEMETAVGKATWLCGRGGALSQAMISIPYYCHTNPTGVKNARRMLAELLWLNGRLARTAGMRTLLRRSAAANGRIRQCAKSWVTL